MSEPNPNIRLGIAGSGAIAVGLAKAAGPNVDTVLRARSEESAERARGRLDDNVRVVTDLGELGDRTYVVEAIAEDHDTKVELLTEINQHLAEDAVLATTTSSLSVNKLADESGRPQKFAGLHVFNPVHRMDLVELAFPDDADELTRTASAELCEAMGKTVVEVPDVPGFVVNRLLFPFAFQAVELAEETGLKPADIDSCMKLGAGHPMGPLALLDFVGLDVSAAIGEQVGADVPRRVYDLIDQGHLGRKSGAGFYEYPKK
ncbi:MAG TPA: 3-hydroxyacyl-CoA dehydrogenase family protein [Thermoleophilaceae bacterium]|nr:3-hydroxyacyl-CoA dehydrogenase family protein [Thermoleophilaceae bacterium]